MNQEWLTSLAILYIEKDIASNLAYNIVINEILQV